MNPNIRLLLAVLLSSPSSLHAAGRSSVNPAQGRIPLTVLSPADLAALSPAGLAGVPTTDLTLPSQLPAVVTPAVGQVQAPAAFPAAAAAAAPAAGQAAAAVEEGPARLTIGGEERDQQPAAVRSANDASEAASNASALSPEQASVGFGAILDGSGAAPRGGSRTGVPALYEVFRPGIARPAAADRVSQLEGIARDVARLRATDPASLSEEERSVLRGIGQLKRLLAVGRTDPARLAQDAAVLEAMPDEQVAALTEAARRFLQPEAGPGPIAANWEHVNLQHLTPLSRDGAELARLFNRSGRLSAERFAARLNLLMMVHDLGKVRLPADMQAALGKAFPDKDGLWFVNTSILPHEYGSMAFIEELGRGVITKRQVLALQRLIANHNFGPDLARAGNATLRDHWWPGFFRRNLIPALAALGVPVERVFNRDEKGELQYNSAEGNVYSALLSAYDRALANKDTGYGVSAWYKFANQDHQGWLKAAEAARGAGKPIPQPVFGGPAVVARMEQSAAWTAEEIDSLWTTLAGYAEGGVPAGFRPRKEQVDGADKLNIVIRWVKSSNPKGETNRADIVETPGVAYYTTLNDSPLGPGGTLFRVVLDYAAPVPAARVEQMLPGGWGTPLFDPSVTPQAGANPVELFFGLIKKDRIVKD